jgi:hypothetical protein
VGGRGVVLKGIRAFFHNRFCYLNALFTAFFLQVDITRSTVPVPTNSNRINHFFIPNIGNILEGNKKIARVPFQEKKHLSSGVMCN